MISAISVKDRLRNKTASSRKTFQEMLIAYGLERTVYRLSVSEYSERFILKGGMFLYALFEGDFARATRDIDFLARNMSNDTESIRKAFINIFSIESDDALQYDLKTLELTDIAEFKEYHGVRVSIMAYLDRTKVPISVDIGFGDIIYPEKIYMEFPVLLDMKAPEIYAYSIPSVIAEKFEAIVSLGNANSRYKDFYDIYILADRYDFDGTELREAIKETFDHRGTSFDDLFAFSDDFIASEIHQSRWKAFIKKKKALVGVELADTVNLLRTLLVPIANSIKSNKDFAGVWNHETRSWT